nr:hypothetical protein GCM10020093_101660 [Planobispora longispora]
MIRIPGLRGKLTSADVDGDNRDDLMFRNGGLVELLKEGLSARQVISPFRRPDGDYDYVTGPVRAGDYDRDGRAEVLLDSWEHDSFGPDPHRWWVWDANAPATGFDTTDFVS